ncbi:Bestrophin-2 [Melipona quadrifasciata]|uniref:Bestrophin homolog n=1 Tax=Melipona quadrifasciata TaxID=166423 RepID=A0A0M9A2L8_9HYME|nr:Bestrophin-2 [Melipona quadrifasciata]
MTVSYQYQVANSTRGGFTRLLFMWRGSLYKLIYRELLLFLILFAALSTIYRHMLNSKQKRDFEQIVIYCDNFINLIPLSFVLGFYVSYVAQRWWQQYQAIPWPDKVMHLIALYVTGNDEYARMLRRAMMRYLNLSLILVLRSISSAVKKRFPTLDHVVDSGKCKYHIVGFMTALELDLFLAVPSVEFNTYWIPCTWFINLLKEARQNHRIPDPQGLKLIMEEFNEFRTKCGLLWSYDWISIPLVYTQVVTLATYSFFAVALIARQYIDGKEKQFQLQIDVAEQLINPFGDDDEDFELNWIIDRHTKFIYLNHCANKIPEEKQTMFLPEVIEEEAENIKPSNHASTMSLAAHPNDSPSCETRCICFSQINPCPETPKTNQTSPETILQFDIQEPPVPMDQTGQKSIRIIETVKKFSSLGRHSLPRIDTNRRPFFTLTKSPKVVVQPWPSTSNLSKPSTQIIDTPSVYTDNVNPWKDYSSRADQRLSFDDSSKYPSQMGEGQYDLENVHPSDDANENPNESPHSDTCQLQCHHSMYYLTLPETPLSTPVKAMMPEDRKSKFLVKRHKSMGTSKKKGIYWKQIVKTDMPVIEQRLPYSKSSPNLKLRESPLDVRRNISDTDSSGKEE